MSVLLLCPFCGGEADYLPDRLMAPGAPPPVFCDGCHASALDAEAWNQRSTPAEVAALRAEVEQAHSYLARLLQNTHPQCEPLPNLWGLCTQIDNMVTEIPKLRAEVERLKSAASTINDEVCQTLGKVLGYPWFKDDPGNFPDSTEAHGVCVGDHVAESIAAEAAERIETLRAEVSEWCQKTQLFEDIVHRRKNERAAIAIAFTKLSAVLRVNMLRHVPGTSHAEIDAAIDACLGPIARAALAKEPGNEG